MLCFLEVFMETTRMRPGGHGRALDRAPPHYFRTRKPLVATRGAERSTLARSRFSVLLALRRLAARKTMRDAPHGDT